MKPGRGRFTLAVELLIGSSLAAGVAASLVALVINLLLARDFEDERRLRAVMAAEMITASVRGNPSEEALRQAAAPLVLSGTLEEALILDSARVEELGGDWEVRPLGGGRYAGVRLPPSQPFRTILTFSLAVITAGLLILSILTPGYISRNLTAPLEEILEEAGRQVPGGARTAAAARASFAELVQKLSERDRELDRLRRLAERRADRAEECSAAVVSSIGAALMALDAEGKLTLFNPSAAELFRLDSGDLGSGFPGGRTKAGAAIGRFLSGIGSEPGEIELEIESGPERRAYSVSVAASPGGSRAVLVNDVTRLRTLERRLAEEAAMAGLGTLSAGVAHEMGNTLCALQGFMDLLARGHSDPRTESILAEAREEIVSAQRMIGSFKSFAGTPEARLDEVTCSSLADSVAAVCSETGARFELADGSCPDACLRADPVLLQRCVLNLVRNAKEADPGGVPEVVVACSRGSFSVSVMDRGPGLPEDGDAVMRPFYSTKQGEGHMGLGLTITRRLAGMMNGDLRASRREGGGAVFEIRLPLCAKEDL
ncbi:hypothetical protein GX411_02220 [Candidatus Fermentibacteria bacterium]|nr:hypothetical protein [Candidatus Fermentibacteria bacterium]